MITTEFELTKHPALIFGVGVSAVCGEHVTNMSGANSRILFVVDSSVRLLGLSDEVIASLESSGHSVTIFDDLTSDPRESSVDSAVRIFREIDANCVVGMGGGSALDVSKLVAVLVDSGGLCSEYALGETPLPYRRTCLITIPTTSGTGSETTGTSIISTEDGLKNWYWGGSLKPDMAILDPQLTISLPPFWTFYTGLDALVHAIESRTNRHRFAANDIFAERAITDASAYLVRATKDPEDIEARSGMMLSASYAGLAIGNTGCAVAHNIGHALGSLASIPHGRAVGVSLSRTLPWTYSGSPDAFDRVGELLGCSSGEGVSDMLDSLADSCGYVLALDSSERSGLDSVGLSLAMSSPSNIAMLEATARDASASDIEQLVELVLS